MHDLDEKALRHIRDWAHDLMINGPGKRDAHGFHGEGTSRTPGDDAPPRPAGIEERGGSSHSDVSMPLHSVKPAEGPQSRGGGLEHGSSEGDRDGMDGLEDDGMPKKSFFGHYSFHSKPTKGPSKAPVGRKGRY